MKLYLGVDGGQSGTTAFIGDETGCVIGVGRAGAVNHVADADARAKFLEVLGSCINAAAGQAGLPAPKFESACCGFSGGPADKDALTREAIKAANVFHHPRRSDRSLRSHRRRTRRGGHRGDRVHRIRSQR